MFIDLSGRGSKKFGDECREDKECSFAGSFCDPRNRKCYCREEYHVTNHIDKCGHRKCLIEYVNYSLVILFSL